MNEFALCQKANIKKKSFFFYSIVVLPHNGFIILRSMP